MDTQGIERQTPDIRAVLSHKARIKHFRPRDLMAATGLEASPELVGLVRMDPAYLAIHTALSSADAEVPPIILTEAEDGSFHIFSGRISLVAHFDVDKERVKALIIDKRDSAAVQVFLNQQAKPPVLTADEDSYLIHSAYQDD